MTARMKGSWRPRNPHIAAWRKRPQRHSGGNPRKGRQEHSGEQVTGDTNLERRTVAIHIDIHPDLVESFANGLSLGGHETIT